MNNTTLAEIVSKIAGQGKNPDVSFLKDNPEAQSMLLMALLSSANVKDLPQDGDKRKFDSFNSPNSTPSPPQVEEETRKVGRKPVTSEDEDSGNPKSKRKAQNRAAQRAFRERKENHVRILQDRVKELEDLQQSKNNALVLENEKLKNMILQLQNENAILHGATSSFDVPLTSLDELQRPQKISRSAYSPASYFDNSTSSSSSKSQSNTPEQQHLPNIVNIDDFLGLDNSMLPSNALLDHSELLLGGSDSKVSSTQIDDIINQHRLTFATDPSQFDFFYPLEATNSDPLDTASIQLPPKDKEDEKIYDIAKAWDKVTEHPRFDEIDIDVLCTEMKKKAVCTDEEHERELQKTINQLYPPMD